MKNSLLISRKIQCVILFLISLALYNSQAQPAKWTVMVYLDADNNLEDAGITDMNEMEVVGSTDSVNIIVQFDRVSGYVSSDGNWTDTRRFRVIHDDDFSTITTSPIEIMGEQNMGDPEVLADFIEWGVTNYPAERYAIVLWNHGGGMWKKDQQRKTGPADKDVCYDDTDDDYLTNFEVGDAIQNSGVHFDIVAYDACLMGMIEVAYQIRDLADIMVASEETIPWDGYDYTAFLDSLANDPEMSSDTLAMCIIDSYAKYYSDDYVTLSAVDLHSIWDVAEKNDTLTRRIIENGNAWDIAGAAWNNTQSFSDISYRDLWSFANQIDILASDASIKSAASDLMLSLENTVFYYYATEDFNYARGLSIYFPENSSSYYPEYEDPAEGRDYADSTGWVEFLHAFHTEYFHDITEPNNHFATATIESQYSTVEGLLKDSADIDIYRVFYPGSGEADVTLYSSYPIDIFLYTVTDTIITKVDSLVNTGLFTQILSMEGRDTNYYYILLRPVETSEELYTIYFNGIYNEYDYNYETPAISAYDDEKPDAGYYSSVADSGVGMIFKGYGNLQGIWYYITDLDAGAGGIQGSMDLKLYFIEDNYFYNQLSDPFPVQPDHVGWNYIDLSDFNLSYYEDKLAIGFSWDGLNSAVIGVDSTYTFRNTLSYNDEEWNWIEDSIAFFIRPVFVVENAEPPLECICEPLSILTSSSGTFDDGSGDNPYGYGCNCAWLIQPMGASSISLTINSLDLETGWDSLYIYDGNSDNANLLGGFSGYISDQTVNSTGGKVYLVFNTNYSASYTGWEISYASVPDNINPSITNGDWILYPNPGNGLIQLENGNSNTHNASIEVVNTMGQLAYKQRISGSTDKTIIDLSNQPKGIYYIRIIGENEPVIFNYILE